MKHMYRNAAALNYIEEHMDEVREKAEELGICKLALEDPIADSTLSVEHLLISILQMTLTSILAQITMSTWIH